MSDVLCLDCDRKIKLPSTAAKGDSITCTNCDAEFELVSMDPPKIDWMYDDDDEYDDDEYDDDEYDDEYDDDDEYDEYEDDDDEQ